MVTNVTIGNLNLHIIDWGLTLVGVRIVSHQ